jgi:acyl-CoA synthetase (AMP-forming)/AMP-acid ligase II
MGLWERAHAAWTELQGLGRLLPGLPALNPFGHCSAAQILTELASTAPNRVGLAYQGERWTWKDIHRRANQYAHFAIRQRLQRGDVVALMMDSRPEYLFIASALNRIGVVSALINTHLSGAALAHAIAIAKPKALLVGGEHVGVIDDVLDRLPRLSKARTVWVQVEPGQEEAARGFRVINAEVAACSAEEPSRRALPETTAPMCYIYTSGTTGLPKAAVISNQRWLEAGLILGRGIGEMTPSDVLYLTLPLYHSAGFLGAWGAVLATGATLALRRKFSASQFWEDVRSFDATVFIYIGELCRYLLSQPPAPDERHHHLRLCMGNGLRPDVWRKFQARFHIPLIREYYGATEGNLGLVNLEGRPGMIGRVLPGVAIVQCDPLTGEILRNHEGRCVPVAEGQRGLLLGRINAVMSFDGYVDRLATRKKIVRDVFSTGDAYFNTGDIVQLHADGWVSFADRVGDTFRWKGENVSTHEVAEILSRARGLQEANVYGVRVNGADGRVGMASLVVSEDFDLDAFARGVVAHLASYQRPYFLRLVPNMQVTGTFKHQKNDYRNEGYDPSQVKDPLYYLDGRRYVRIDPDLYRRIAEGEIGPH